MGKEDIDASRKKLGLNKPKKAQDLGLCQVNGCSSPATNVCKYCKKPFCEIHSTPRLVMSPNYIWYIDRSDTEKFNKYEEDWKAKDGHTCLEYTKVWNANHEKKKTEEYEKINNAFDALRSRSQNEKGYRQNSNYGTSNKDYVRYEGYTRGPQRDSRSHLSIFYDGLLLKYALAFSIVITILATLPIELISIGGLIPNVDFFATSEFLTNFIVIFIIFAIYRKVVASQLNYWAGMTISILSSVMLLCVVGFTHIVGVLNFIEVLIFLFVASYVGILVGKGLDGNTHNNKRKVMVNLGKTVIVIFGIGILAGLSLLSLNFIKAGTSMGGNAYNIANDLRNGIGKVSNIINPTNFVATINGTWATSFFSNVSEQRGEQYNYCANLSDFAKMRFNTMVQNYGISHYGYAKDFNKTWPYGVSYGDEIYYGFGEEVFYPSGYMPSSYVQQIITTAPLHWQELTDKNLTTYGYYIDNGPAYEILGPNDGYTACPVTEIPGPNINISQYFAQYGCSVETANLTYFVIELAPFCPSGG